MPMCCTAAPRRSTWTSGRRRSPCPTTVPPWLTSAATLSNPTLTLPSSGIQCEFPPPLSIFWTLQHVQVRPGDVYRGDPRLGRRWGDLCLLQLRSREGARVVSGITPIIYQDDHPDLFQQVFVLHSKSSGNLVCSSERRPRPEWAGDLRVVCQVILVQTLFHIISFHMIFIADGIVVVCFYRQVTVTFLMILKWAL